MQSTRTWSRKKSCEACKKKCKGQAIKLEADKYFHTKCFKCSECDKQLSSDKFFIKDGRRLCSEDYNKLFAVECSSCRKKIENQVVTALGKYYHSECLCCSICRKKSDPGDKLIFNGTDFSCLQCQQTSSSPGDACNGSSSSASFTPKTIPNGIKITKSPDSGYAPETFKDDSCLETSQTLSPISFNSEFKPDDSLSNIDFFSTPDHTPFVRGDVLRHSDLSYGTFYRSSFLDKKGDYKRGPSLNPPSTPTPPRHFHRPENFSYKNNISQILKPIKSVTKQFQTPNKQSKPPPVPVKSEEPIQLAKFPNGFVPDQSSSRPIERMDFPSPPDPAAVYPELLREKTVLHRRSNSCTVDMVDSSESNREIGSSGNPKRDKEISELAKMSDSGAAKVILDDLVKESANDSFDPRSAARSPSAASEPHSSMRCDSAFVSSPSRLSMRSRLQSINEDAASQKTISSPSALVNRRLVPKPGYGLKVSTLDSRNGYLSDNPETFVYTSTGRRRPTSSAAVLEYYIDSWNSDTEDCNPLTGLKRNSLLRSTVLPGRCSATPSSSSIYPLRNIPKVLVHEPNVIYPYDRLKLSCKDKPPGINRERLEDYLSDGEFERLFSMSRSDFCSLAEWKRNDLKKRLELF